MTIQTVPYALQAASHSAALFRQSASAAFISGGCLTPGELNISQQGSPNMSVILGPGRGKVVGTSASPPSGLPFTTQAMYDVLNDANLTLTVTTANATNPRIDVPYIQVQDSFYSGPNNQAIAGIVAGVPAPSPVAPAVPLNAIGLQPIAVAANATSIVTANIGSVKPLAALLPSKPYALASDVVACGSSGPTTITFPAGRFSVTPNVLLTIISTSGGVVSVPWVLVAASATSIGVGIYTLGGAQVAGSIAWTATQMTFASAAG